MIIIDWESDLRVDGNMKVKKFGDGFFNAPVISVVLIFVVSAVMQEWVQEYVANNSGRISDLIGGVVSSESEIGRLTILVVLSFLFFGSFYGLIRLMRLLMFNARSYIAKHTRLIFSVSNNPREFSRDYPDCSHLDQMFPYWQKIDHEVSSRFPWAWSFIVIRYGSSLTDVRSSNDIDLGILLIGNRDINGKVADKSGKHDGRSPLFDLEFCDYSLAISMALIGDPFYHALAKGRLESGNEDYFQSFVHVCRSANVSKKSVLENSKLRCKGHYEDFIFSRSDLGFNREQSKQQYENIYDSNHVNENTVNVVWSIKAYLLVCSILQIIIVESSKQEKYLHNDLVSLSNPHYLTASLAKLRDLDSKSQVLPKSSIEDLLKVSKELIDNYKLKSNEADYLGYQVLKEKIESIIIYSYLEG